MVVDESGYTQLLRDLRQLPGVKKVFVRSGIRFDYTMADASDEFLRELLELMENLISAKAGTPPAAS